jgi:hypothetical protein
MKYKKTSNDGVEALVHTYIHTQRHCVSLSTGVSDGGEEEQSEENFFETHLSTFGKRTKLFQKAVACPFFSLITIARAF